MNNVVGGTQKKWNPKKNPLKICQATSPFFSSKDSAETHEASKQKPDQVEDIEPSTICTSSKRKLLQNRCPNRCSNSLRKLRRSLRFSRHFEEKALNAKRQEVLLHAISSLTAKLSIPPPCHCFYPLVLYIILFAPTVCTVCLTLVISYPGYFSLLLCLV